MGRVRGFKEITLELAGRNQKAATPATRAREDAGIHAALSTTRITDRNAAGNLSTYGGDNAVDYVAEAIDLIATTTSGAGWHVERDGQRLVPVKAPTDPAELEEAPGDLVNLIAAPNLNQTWAEFVELLVIDFLLAGNAYWLKNSTDAAGKPASLFRLHPEKVTIHPGRRKLVDRYTYQPGNGQEFTYSPDEVIHFRRTNPHDEHIGLGLISAGPNVFNIELAMTDSMRAYYESGTRVSGVLESERPLAPTVFQKIKNQIATLYAGAKNSYQVPILENGLKWKTISATAAEAEYRYLAPQSQARILALLRVPKPLLGLGEGWDRGTVRESQRTFDNKTMIPFLDRIAAVISEGLTKPGWGLDFRFDYEYVMPIEDRLDLAQSFGALPGVTVREVREFADLPPLGDDQTDEQGNVIDEIVLNLPGDNQNESKIKDKNLGSEPGRPPNPENTASFNTNTGDEDARVR